LELPLFLISFKTCFLPFEQAVGVKEVIKWPQFVMSTPHRRHKVTSKILVLKNRLFVQLFNIVSSVVSCCRIPHLPPNLNLRYERRIPVILYYYFESEVKGYKFEFQRHVSVVIIAFYFKKIHKYFFLFRVSSFLRNYIISLIFQYLVIMYFSSIYSER
jgi:hypothetical protein